MKRAPQWYAEYMKGVFNKHRAEDGTLEVTVRSQASKSFSAGQKNIPSVRLTEVIPPKQLVVESESSPTYELVEFSPKGRRDSSGRGGPSTFSNSPSAVAQARRFFGGPSDDRLKIVPRSESLPLISRPSHRDLGSVEDSMASLNCNTSRTPSNLKLNSPPSSSNPAGSGRSWIWKPAELPAMRPVTASFSFKQGERSASPLGRPGTSSGGQRHVVLLQPPSPSDRPGSTSPTKDPSVSMPQVSPLLVLASESSSGSLSPKGFKGSSKLRGSLRPQF
jgi:hypothetical protein